MTYRPMLSLEGSGKVVARSLELDQSRQGASARADIVLHAPHATESVFEQYSTSIRQVCDGDGAAFAVGQGPSVIIGNAHATQVHADVVASVAFTLAADVGSLDCAEASIGRDAVTLFDESPRRSRQFICTGDDNSGAMSVLSSGT